MTDNIKQRTFERLQDFNLIYVADFNKLKFPDFVQGAFIKRYDLKVPVRNFLLNKKLVDNTELPQEVIDSFSFGVNTIAHKGIIYKKVSESDEEGEVYCDSFNDSSELIKQALDLPELKHTLKVIDNITRKSVMTKDLLSLPGFKPIENETLGNISLDIQEISNSENKVKMCKIVLKVEKDFVPVSIYLGILTYSIYGRRI